MTEGTWRIHDVAPAPAIRVTRAMPSLAPALDAAVEAAWHGAQARMGKRLFNGRVFSADAIASDRIDGHWTEFRRIVAQMDRPELFADLGVRPLAVGGVIAGPGFVLFGSRPDGAVYQPGEWQLPPAGSIDPSAETADGHIDPLRQLHAELAEEIGLPASAVHGARALAIVEHAGSHVCDLGIALATGWDAAAIAAVHAARGDGEYGELAFVAPAELPAFLARHAGRVTRQAPVFLARAGLLPG